MEHSCGRTPGAGHECPARRRSAYCCCGTEIVAAARRSPQLSGGGQGVSGSADLAFVGAFAQHEFLDLAGRGLRQVEEYHVLRYLEPSQVLAAEADDVLLGHLLAGLEGDEGAGCLAPSV